MDRRTVLAGAAGLSAFAARAARAQPAPQGLSERTMAAILKASGAPAFAAAVVGRDGVRWAGAAGVRRRGSPALVTLTDRWHLGSQAKAMTAMAYARLVEAGRLRWGATLPSLFPELTVHPSWRTTMIDQVLSHASGMRRDLWPEVQQSARFDRRPLPVQRAQAVARLLAAPPDETPGQYLYSNVGYLVAGAAIERATGRSAEAALHSVVFRPLGVTAGLGAPRGASPWGHSNGRFGVPPGPIDPASAFADNPPISGPGGGYCMSVGDYARFLQVYLRPEGFLRLETLKRLLTPAVTGARPYAGGWSVETRPWAEGPVLIHEGTNSMWLTRAVVVPSKGLAFIGCANAYDPEGAEACALSTGTLIARFIPEADPDRST